MQGIAIFPIVAADGAPSFRAVARSAQSEGRTAGEALDALASRLPGDIGTVVVIQPFLPDALFSAAQQARLQDLMAKWRAARDSGRNLTSAEQTELEALVDAELQAATTRTADVLKGLSV